MQTHAGRKRKRREEQNLLVSRLDMALPDEARQKNSRYMRSSVTAAIVWIVFIQVSLDPLEQKEALKMALAPRSCAAIISS